MAVLIEPMGIHGTLIPDSGFGISGERGEWFPREAVVELMNASRMAGYTEGANSNNPISGRLEVQTTALDSIYAIYKVRCTTCRKLLFKAVYEATPDTVNRYVEQTNYCPNCGVKIEK